MNNLVLITSVICTPNIPLSYISTRSVFTHEERYEQTKKTIASIRKQIPNSKIFIVECSDLNTEQNDHLIENTDYFLNLYDDEHIRKNIYSKSKSLGEGTMTIKAIEFIKKNNITFDNFFKITGRYWLSNNFNYDNFDNTEIQVHYINNDTNNGCTSLYKLHYINIDDFYHFLLNNIENMIKCIGYEVLFAMFLKQNNKNNIIHLNKIGVNGYISVSNDYVDN
jgi:hypothetical protein